MKLKIHDAKGKATEKSVDLSKDIFGIEPKPCDLFGCQTTLGK